MTAKRKKKAGRETCHPPEKVWPVTSNPKLTVIAPLSMKDVIVIPAVNEVISLCFVGEKS
jgi:hypothetical protein